MAKHYKYVNGKRLIVVNNYELGSDVIPEEVELIPDITQADQGKVLTADENGEPKWSPIPSQFPALSGNGGKVLKVNSGATGVEWGNESTELPALTGNAGKVLKVNAGATGTEWADETTELPGVTSADEGDVLTVNASGQWAKATPSGGGGFVATFTARIPNADGTITNITCDKTYAEVMEAVEGEGASFRVVDQFGTVTPSCGQYWLLEGDTVIVNVNIFGIPDNTLGTMSVAGLSITYGENSLTAEYSHGSIGLIGG